MRVLMSLWDGGGTVPVELGVARRLVAAGHQATVIAEPMMEPAVLATGAGFRPWLRAPHPVQDVVRDWECTNPVMLFRRLLDRLVTGPSAQFAADVREFAAREDGFDVAFVDAALMGALVATESLGIPTAAAFPGGYLRPNPGEPPFGLGLSPARGPLGRLRDQALPRAMDRLWNLGLGQLNETRAGIGLGPLSRLWEQLDRADRVLVLTAESFDFPARRPGNVRYVGPVLDDPPWADVDVELPPGDEPLVLGGLSGTRMRGGAELLQHVVAGLAAAPVRAVVCSGPTTAPLASPTPRVRVVNAAPHTRLLADVAAVVTHGGHGTVIKTLAAGRPLLVLPLGRDQPDNAARVVWHGAGLRLRRTASPREIATAVTRLVEDPAYRRAAEVLGQRIRAETSDQRILRELESIAAAS